MKSLKSFSKFMLKYILANVIIIILLGLFILWQNHSIESNVLNISSPKLPSSFDGYKILHLSDIHNDFYGRKQKKLINKIQSANPDIITITGDLIDSDRYDLNKILPLMEDLSKIADIYYVYGNHEIILNPNPDEHPFKIALANLGVKFMNMELVKIHKDDEYLNLLGIPDPITTDTYKNLRDISSYKERVRTMLDTVTDTTNVQDSFTVLLSHRPEYFDVYANYNFDLVLTGHAHGGQFRFPGLGGLYAPGQGFMPKYTSGVYVRNDTDMFVSRGLGNSRVPIRIFNRPEITTIILQKEEI